MAELLVLAAIQALTSAIIRETLRVTFTFSTHQLSLITEVHEKMDEMKRDLESIQSLLCLADQKTKECRRKSRDGDVHGDILLLVGWVKRVRDVAFKVEDIMDNHMYDIAECECGGGIRGITMKRMHKVRLPAVYRRTGQELERIRPEVKEIMTTYIAIISGMFSRLLVDASPHSDTIQEATSSSSSSLPLVRPEEGDCFFSPNERGILPIDEMERWILEPPTEFADVSAMKMDVRWMGIAIYGMGGVGKTTLLRNLYFKEDLNQKFDCCAWVTVSKNYRVVQLFRKILKDLGNENTERQSEEELIQTTHSILHQKRYLIVFDDVWDVAFWSKIKNIFRKDHDRRSRILFTTRDKEVASDLAREERVMFLDPLKENEAWLLFCKKAFWQYPTSECPPELQPWARRIVAKCGGLPLAIVVVAGMMSRKERNTSDWERSYKMLAAKLNEDPLLSIMMHSYYALPSHLKRCFLYCIIFPEYYCFWKIEITDLWIGEGFIEERNGMTMEEVAEEYLRELVERSMIEKEKTRERSTSVSYRMHDVLRTIALDVSRGKKFLAIVDTDNHFKPSECETRRLSIHKNVTKAPVINLVVSKLRSLSSWGVQVSDQLSSLQKFRLLKVLNLADVPISNIPKEIFDLFNMRYMNLRDTGAKMTDFLKRIGRLQNLLYLDLDGTNVLQLPCDVTRLQKLRHLYIGDWRNDRGCKIPMDVCFLKDLQTLQLIEANEQLLVGLENRTQLRRIGIANVKQAHVVSLFNSLNRLVHLTSLNIFGNSGDFIDIEHMLNHPPFPHLQWIHIRFIKSIPAWFHSLGNLREVQIVAFGRREDENPLQHLISLPCLEYLVLGVGFEVLKLSFPQSSFAKLVRLTIFRFPNLESIQIDEGALPCLCTLRIKSCKYLRGPLPRIQNLQSLKVLGLVDMAAEIVQEFQEMCDQLSYLKLTVSS